jgi:hypothetical protein
MKKLLVGLLALLILLMNGCAQKADKIKAAYVTPLTYEKYSCTELKDEAIRVNKRLTEISDQQVKGVVEDAAAVGTGIIFLWPIIFFRAEDEEQKAEIRSLKGQYETIRDVAIKKKCDFVASMK